jgi:hypothetical protein
MVHLTLEDLKKARSIIEISIQALDEETNDAALQEVYNKMHEIHREILQRIKDLEATYEQEKV